MLFFFCLTPTRRITQPQCVCFGAAKFAGINRYKKYRQIEDFFSFYPLYCDVPSFSPTRSIFYISPTVSRRSRWLINTSIIIQLENSGIDRIGFYFPSSWMNYLRGICRSKLFFISIDTQTAFIFPPSWGNLSVAECIYKLDVYPRVIILKVFTLRLDEECMKLEINFT